MKIVNGVRTFTLEMTQQELNLLSKFLANQEYVERSTLINSINQQMQAQISPAPLKPEAQPQPGESQ